MEENLVPHLFRTEYRKIVAVLCKVFGIEYIQIAEDITSDTFLLATELWGIKGTPPNPAAWLYTVAKNKAKDYLKRDALFKQSIKPAITYTSESQEELEIDLSVKNIVDSQLQMMFAICHPSISTEAQIGLSLRILCGFGISEIADAFLSNKETINKRLLRAKHKLRDEKVKIEYPAESEIPNRIESVLTTLYLLFNEGYYSSSKDSGLRKDLCMEAMRLTYLLAENKLTNSPSVNALLSLMCFHASRFEARTNKNGEPVLYEEQDTNLWDVDLIHKGEFFLNQASQGNEISKYHLEAGIAYWHTIRTNSIEKWDAVLQLYNRLLQLEYSPMAALNRTFALYKVNGKASAIAEAEKLGLDDHHLYHSLLGELYNGLDKEKSLSHLTHALNMAKSVSDKNLIANKIKIAEQHH